MPEEAPKRLIRSVVTIAAAIVALSGAVKVVSEIPNWWQKRHAASTEFERTPRLGLQFWQAKQAVPMFFRDADQDIVQVKMKPAAFVMSMPKVAEGMAVQVCAWNDESIFRLRQEMPEEEVAFFALGTGFSDYEYGSGTLFLDNEAHNYLIDTRLSSRSEQQDEAYFSTLFLDHREFPLSNRRDPLFLVIYIDKNANHVIELGEYEYVQLDF